MIIDHALISRSGFSAQGFLKPTCIPILSLATAVALLVATIAVAQTVPPNAGGVPSLQEASPQFVTPQAYVSRSCRAAGVNIADGQSHPLSSCGYVDLKDAKNDYPFAVSLRSEVAWAAHQKAFGSCTQLRGSGSSSESHPGGCHVFTPPGKYFISDPLRLTNSTQWSGNDWGTILWFNPDHPTDMMITTSEGERVGNSNQAISLRHLFITNSYRDATQNFPNYNLNAHDAIDFRNTRLFSIEDVTIVGFVNGVGIRAGYYTSVAYAFFNRIVSPHIKNCYRSIQLDPGASSLQIIGGELGNDVTYLKCPSETCKKMKDYEVYIDQAAAVAIFGTTLEGAPTEAHIYDSGSGTTILGVYTESQRSNTPMVKRPKLTPFSNGFLFGHYASYPLLKLEDRTAATGSDALSFGYTLPLGSPSPVHVFAKNLSLNQGPAGDWGLLAGGCLSSEVNVGYLARSSVGLTKSSANQYCGLSLGNLRMPPWLYGRDVFVTIYASSESTINPEMFVQTPQGGKNFKQIVSLESGWSLWAAQVPLLGEPADLSIYMRMTPSTPAGSKLRVSNLQFWVGGIPLVAAATGPLSEAGIDPNPPSAGTWLPHDQVWVENPAPGGPLAYVCVTAGTQGIVNGKQTLASLKDGTSVASVNSIRGLYVGAFVEIEGYGKAQVTSVTDGAVGLSRKAARAILRAPTSYSPAVFSALGR